MTESPRKAIAARLIAAAGQGDADAVAALIADDFVLEQMVHDPDAGGSAAGTSYNRASYLELLGYVRQLTRDGMNLAIERMVEEDGEVAVFGTSDAVSPGGWHYRNAYCWLLTFREGKVLRMREYYDTALGARLLEG
jgi:ketosteroid isomerase-like protein